MSRSAWRSPSRRVHSSLEVLPARLRDHDVRLRNCGRALAQHVKQDDQVAGAPVENSIELRAVVAAQLTQLAAHLARVREWRRRCRGRLIIQSAACARRAQQRTHRPARTHPVRDSRRLACEARRISTDALGRANPQINFPVLAPNSRQSGRGSSGLRRLTAVSRCRVPAATTPPNPAQTCGKRLRKADSSGVGKRQGFPGPGISRPPHSTALPPLQGGRRQG